MNIQPGEIAEQWDIMYAESPFFSSHKSAARWWYEKGMADALEKANKKEVVEQIEKTVGDTRDHIL